MARVLLAAPEDESEGLFRFGDGPAIRLVHNERPGIQEMVIRLHSLERARNFLAGRARLESGFNLVIATYTRSPRHKPWHRVTKQ